MASLEKIYHEFLNKIESLEQDDSNGTCGYTREFLSLRKTSASYKEDKVNYATEVGQLAINKVKNRFKDILPFDSTRVKLPSTGVEGSDYINANHIKGVDNKCTYIASQGPLPNTVNDFWRMLWSYNVKVVVMLCREKEGGKKKCQRYWPKNTEENLTFNGISVKMKKVLSVGDDITMRTLIAECDGEQKVFTQFHYMAWPDHGVPFTTAPLVELLKLVREYQPEDDPPIVFHCSAGCGRTGTICALDYTNSLLKQVRASEIDPYIIVEDLRKQRTAMVQTKAQYEFMCQSICALFRTKLRLPIDEDMENHLYENVSRQNNSDSDSESNLSPMVISPNDPFSNNTSHTKEKCGLLLPSGVKQPPSPLNTGKVQKRAGQSIQPSSDSYVNVSLDLIDLSDESGGPSKTKPGNTQGEGRPFNSSQILTRSSLKALRGVSRPQENDGGSKVQAKVLSQGSSEDYVVPNRPQNSRSLETAQKNSGSNLSQTKPIVVRQSALNSFLNSATSKTSEDLNKTPSQTASPQVNKTPPATMNRSFKKPNLPPTTQDGRRYENVLVPLNTPPPSKKQNRPAAAAVAAVAVPTQPSLKYENVEIPVQKVEQRKLVQHRGTNEKPAKPASPTKPEFFRRLSAREHENKPSIHHQDTKPSSYGRKAGQNISNALPRAKVLPNDSKGEKNHDSEKLRKQQFMEEVNSGLYAQVNRRSKPASRMQLNDTTSTVTDTVDGEQGPGVPMRSPDVFSSEEHHDASRDGKPKTSSLTDKFSALLLKKPEHEVRVTHLENIGYGIRLPKPKGPRDPPKAWMVKT